jgi:hypothetical protein
VGFALLAKHFEYTEIPAVLPRYQPRSTPRNSAATTPAPGVSR